MFKVILYCMCALASLQAYEEQGSILLQQMTPDMLESVGLQGKHGVIITDLNEYSPATKELKKGDVIIKINGESVYSPDQLMQAFDKANGEKVPLTVWRNGELANVFLYTNAKSSKENILGGAEFATNQQGVVVKRAGITGLFEKGDLVLQFNGKPVKSDDDIIKAVANNPNAFSVTINRKGMKISQTFAMDKNGNTSFSQSISIGRGESD